MKHYRNAGSPPYVQHDGGHGRGVKGTCGAWTSSLARFELMSSIACTLGDTANENYPTTLPRIMDACLVDAKHASQDMCVRVCLSVFVCLCVCVRACVRACLYASMYPWGIIITHA